MKRAVLHDTFFEVLSDLRWRFSEIERRQQHRRDPGPVRVTPEGYWGLFNPRLKLLIDVVIPTSTVLLSCAAGPVGDGLVTRAPLCHRREHGARPHGRAIRPLGLELIDHNLSLE